MEVTLWLLSQGLFYKPAEVTQSLVSGSCSSSDLSVDGQNDSEVLT